VTGTGHERQAQRLLRRDPELARLIEVVQQWGTPDVAEQLLSWASARDTERVNLANEALDRYRELNLLYELAEHAVSLDPATIVGVAGEQLARVARRGAGVVLLIDAGSSRVRPAEPVAERTATAGLPARGFPVGEGIIGAVAADQDGEIVNDTSTDARASLDEKALGAMMLAPLRSAGRVLGVLLVTASDGTEFTAGEHRMLSAVAALIAPALKTALEHEQTIASARAREAELQRQLDELRTDAEQRRQEERVAKITGSDYFRSLRQEADVLRRVIGADQTGGDRP
jgi:GAF domain-containing protein